MKTMRGYPNNIRGNGHRRTKSDVRALTTTKQHDSTIIAPKTTHWAQRGDGATTELHGTARKRGDNNEDNGRDNEDNYKKEIFDNKKNNMTQQQLRPKQHFGRKGGMGRPLNCTELHGNEGTTMKTTEETMKTMQGVRMLFVRNGSKEIINKTQRKINKTQKNIKRKKRRFVPKEIKVKEYVPTGQ